MTDAAEWGRAAPLSGGRFVTITATGGQILLVIPSPDWRRPQAQITVAESDLETIRDLCDSFLSDQRRIHQEAHHAHNRGA